MEGVLLGGDIHYLPDHLNAMLTAIRQTQRSATEIIVVPGNGEYIDQELNESRRQYRLAVETVPNAVFLDDDVVVLPSGLRVIGSTLWSHVADDEIGAYSALLAGHGLQGVDNIRMGDRFLSLIDTNDFHLRARSFIEGELRRLAPEDREETIVCTHFWPTLRPWLDSAGSIDPKTGSFDGIDSNSYQMVGSNMDALIADCGPKLWLCGHAHTTRSARIGRTHIASNPRAGNGPGNINPDFSERYVVDLSKV